MRLPGSASLTLLLARRSLSSSPAASSRSSSSHATRANRARCGDAGRAAPSWRHPFSSPSGHARFFHGTRPVVARDYYDVLDVKKDAGQGEIKKAYYAVWLGTIGVWHLYVVIFGLSSNFSRLNLKDACGFKPWRSCYGVEVSFEMLAKQLNIITISPTYLHQRSSSVKCEAVKCEPKCEAVKSYSV
ncbi:chaperone protein DnaJ-like [Hordeum vulgare]|nr:chaperone protein DnaJ-like [Hordeum vulgare]